MLLEGSCHCGAVSFSVRSSHPHPFNLCYCSICRKTAGGGGFAINVSGEYDTLRVYGQRHIKEYRAKFRDPTTGNEKTSPGRRSFCSKCGSALWSWDPRWPEQVYPFASAVDSELPVPPERTHMMLEFKASWVEIRADAQDQQFDGYPKESLAEWHQRLGLEER